MEIIKKKQDINRILADHRQKSQSIGFIPTMGAIHKGHLSLVDYSVKENDVTVVSIFVNPTQFNENSDFENYPRMLEEDTRKLSKHHCDYIFAPSAKEMYPEPDKRLFDFGHVDKIMEGKYRKGHFNGVAIIVDKLFRAINPDRAYFGEKDYQQIVVIKKLTEQLNHQVQIITCPILREEDGLAMSSRNALLSAAERETAPAIAQTLFEAASLSNSYSVKEIKDFVINKLNRTKGINVEYFEIADENDLILVSEWDEKPGPKRGFIAARLGNVRLIDNVRIKD